MFATSATGAPETPLPASGPPEIACAEERRNYRLGVANGALYQAGEGLIDANTVIPLFLSRLTTSNALIGLSAGLGDMGWFLPQFLVTPYISRFPRQLWLYRAISVLRVGGLLALAAAIPLLVGSHRGALLWVFFACYSLYCAGAGLAGVSFMEVVSKTVRPHRLGSFWAQRLFWGGLLAAAAGLGVREAMKIADLGLRYSLLFGLAGVLGGVAYGLFGATREPAGTPERTADSPLGMLREGFRMLRGDAPFQRLFLSRATLSVWFTVSPFMVLFAVRDLGGGPRAAGTFLFARVTGYVLSNLAWQPLSRRFGNRALMRIGTLACSLLALLSAAVAVASPWALGWISARAAVLALEGVTALGGAAQSAITVGYASLLLQLPPPGKRQAFVSLMNSFLGPTMLLPVLGGALVDRLNAPVLFALCGLVALAGFGAAARLRDSRGVEAESFGAWSDSVRAGGGGR